MIRSLVDSALNNRFVVLSIALLLFVWGVIAFKKLPATRTLSFVGWAVCRQPYL